MISDRSLFDSSDRVFPVGWVDAMKPNIFVDLQSYLFPPLQCDDEVKCDHRTSKKKSDRTLTTT